jgi:4-alpha-glucanotransferase
MAPIAGFWTARDIEIRAQVGLMDQSEVEKALEWRMQERGALVERLAREVELNAEAEISSHELRGAVHTMMCQTPCALVGLALDDLAGEIEPVNVPGVGQDQFVSWTRKMRIPIETIALSADSALPWRSGGRHSSRNA